MPTKKISGTAVLVFGALVLAACGGGSSAASSKTTTPTSTGSATNANKLRDCLRQHGVDLPAGAGAPAGDGQGGLPGGSANGGTPPSLPAGVDPQKLQSAFQACGGGFPGGGGAPGGANSQAFQAYASCLRDHGVKVPTSTKPGSTPPSFDRTSSAFVAANKVCSALLPSRPSTSPTTAASN